MNNVLNGTGWGETTEPELKVPDLDCWRAEAAIEEQSPVWQDCIDSMQRGRRLRSRAAARRREERLELAAITAFFGFLVFAAWLSEVLV